MYTILERDNFQGADAGAMNLFCTCVSAITSYFSAINQARY